MLPDFPSFTREVLARLDALTRAKRGGIPFADLLPPFQHHEGDGVAATRTDGVVTRVRFDDPITATATLTLEEVRAQGAGASLAAIERLHAELDEGMGRRTVAAIEAAAASVGNVQDMKGRPFTGAAVLDAYERMEMDFPPDGTWRPPRVLLHPDNEAKLAAAMDEIARDPVLAARRDDIVNRQREAWRGREARRQLAD